jgi:hypothetical protein
MERIAKISIANNVFEEAFSKGFRKLDAALLPYRKFRDIKIHQVDNCKFPSGNEVTTFIIKSPDLPEVEEGQEIPEKIVEYFEDMEI